MKASVAPTVAPRSLRLDDLVRIGSHESAVLNEPGSLLRVANHVAGPAWSAGSSPFAPGAESGASLPRSPDSRTPSGSARPLALRLANPFRPRSQ